MRRRLVFTRDLPVPPERVWSALTTPGELAAWLMENDIVAEVGRDFEFRGAPRGTWDGVVHCTVTEVVVNERLAYTWRSDALDTVVSWTLERTARGTRLRLTHSGFAGVRGVALSFVLARGWRTTILPGLEDRLRERDEAGIVPASS